MSPTLNHYPTTAQIRALIDQDQLDELVSEISDYQKTETLATYTGNSTPDILRSWAGFANVVQSIYPDATIGRDFSIKRDLTTPELEEIALSSQQSKRYYHPENFPLDYAYDDESEKYIPVADVKNDKAHAVAEIDVNDIRVADSTTQK
jgi:hypothetical protein